MLTFFCLFFFPPWVSVAAVGYMIGCNHGSRLWMACRVVTCSSLHACVACFLYFQTCDTCCVYVCVAVAVCGARDVWMSVSVNWAGRRVDFQGKSSPASCTQELSVSHGHTPTHSRLPLPPPPPSHVYTFPPWCHCSACLSQRCRPAACVKLSNSPRALSSVGGVTLHF